MASDLEHRDDRFVLSTATHRLVVSRHGGRIVEYSVGGRNVLATAGTYLQQGSTFWVAPQSHWETAWPPSEALDVEPYREFEGHELERAPGSTADLRLRSEADPALGVWFQKDITLHADGSVRLRYAIHAEREVTWAPWEVTRLRPGLCFFSPGAHREPILDPAVEAVEIVPDEGVAWVPFDAGNDRFRTLLADADGWCGYAHDGLLLLKSFPAVASSAFAPGNGSLKVWWQNNEFIELEQVGPHVVLTPGTPEVYDVAWQLQALGPEVEVAPRSASLAALLPWLR